MFSRRFQERPGFVGLILLLALLVAGCGKREPSSTPVSTPPHSSQTLLATHWIGKTRMAQDTNAAYQVEIWNLPESVRLERQTLDKFARALPDLLGIPGGGDTNVVTGALRPLLDDVIQAESFAELRATTNHRPVEFALAIRLSPERAAAWQSNIAVLKAALAVPSTNSAASMKSVHFTQVGAWAILGLGADDHPLFAEFVQRFNAANLSSINHLNPSNLWFELDADLGRLVRSNSILPTESLPFVHLTLAGDGQNVQTRGELTFPKPLESRLEPWNIPTHLIHDPLVSFTAVRGVKPWLESSGVWRNLPAGESPNQLYAWALQSVPFQTYFSADWPGSSNRFYELSEQLLRHANPRFASNDIGHLERLTNLNGLTWKTVPFFSPFLQHQSLPMGEAVFGGFFTLEPGKRPIPPELVAQLLSQTNLVYYDWEITSPRVEQLTYLIQLLRLLAGQAQAKGESAGVKWFQAIAPKLGNAVTGITQTGPRRLGLSRSSSAGFTGFELHLLADWFESPDFPHGLHTFLAPAAITPSARRKAGVPASASPTNGVTAQPGSKP